MTGPWQAAFLVLAAMVLALGIIVLGLLRRFSEALERVESRGPAVLGPSMGLPAGSHVPPITLLTATGERVRLFDPAAGHDPFVVLLLEPECIACKGLLADLDSDGWSDQQIALLVVLPDDPESRKIELPDSGARILYQIDRGASAGLDTNSTPLAFVLDPPGVVLGSTIPEDLPSLAAFATRSQTEGGMAHSHSR